MTSDPTPQNPGSQTERLNSIPERLGPEAHELFLQLAAGQSLPPDVAPAAQRQLEAIGLLRITDSGTSLAQEDPRTVTWILLSALYARAREQLGTASAVPDRLARLEAAYRRSRADRSDGVLTLLDGIEVVNDAIIQAFDEVAPQELLTAQPHGPRKVNRLAPSQMKRSHQVIEQGGQMRTLYQSSARWHPYTREMVETMTAAGVQVRTVPLPFPRMIIMDRAVAFLPIKPLDDVLNDKAAGREIVAGYQGALVVRHPAIIGHLADAFDGLWSRARPWDGSVPTGAIDLEESETVILQYLDRGLTLEAIAARLGTSTRTVTKQINGIKSKFQVQSHYGLGRRWEQLQAEARTASA